MFDAKHFLFIELTVVQLTHKYTHVHTRTHIYTHVHTRTHTYTHVHTRTHMYTHVHTRTHTYAHVHTRIHTGHDGIKLILSVSQDAKKSITQSEV